MSLDNNVEASLLTRRFVRYGEGSTRYNMGLAMFQRLAREAKAEYRIDGMPVLVNCRKFEAYLDRVCA